MDKIKKIVIDTEKKVININGQDFSSVSYFNLVFSGGWHLEVKHSFNNSGEPVAHREPPKIEHTTTEVEIAEKLLDLMLIKDVDFDEVQKIATATLSKLSSGKNEV